MERFSRYDIPYIRLTDFMEAIGKKPTAKQGDRLIYNAPYNIESLYRAYGIETMGKPTCAVNPGTNKWEDTEWSAYARGGLYSLAGEICNFTKDKEAVERYIIDVLTDYNREHTVSLMPMPSVRIINEGSVSVIDIRPKEIDLDDFVRQIGYRQIHRDGEWRGFSAPAGQKSYPDILVNTSQNKWYDYNSSDSGDVYALASRLTRKRHLRKHYGSWRVCLRVRKSTRSGSRGETRWTNRRKPRRTFRHGPIQKEESIYEHRRDKKHIPCGLPSSSRL